MRQIFFALVIVWVGVIPAQTIRFESAHATMGSQFYIVCYAPDSATAQSAVATAWARIDQMNATLSDYDAESELFRLNLRAGEVGWVPVSADLYHALKYGKRLARKTDGAFDPTVGPLSRVWRKAFNQGQLPDSAAIAGVLPRVGYEKLEIHPFGRKVRLTDAGMRVDPGAFVKGWAADEGLRILKEAGIEAALVDAGGDLALGAAPPGTAGWRVEISLPDPEGNPSAGIALLSHCGIATSGDAYRYLDVAGVRYSHLVDPKTGKGVTHAASVTALARNGLKADAFATALSVMPPDKALVFSQKNHIGACWTIREGDKVVYRENRIYRKIRLGSD
jgi:thiamine biosynthesis lipoprotein